MRTQWNDDEDEALHGLPWIAQLAYLRALRPYMDYANGIVGQQRGVSLKSISEVLHVEHGQGRRDSGDPSVKAVRHALELLESAGVIEKMKADRKLVFRLPLADTDYSASDKWGRRGADVGQTKQGRDEPSNGASCGEKWGRRGAEGQPERWGTLPYSVFREEGTNVPLSPAAPSDSSRSAKTGTDAGAIAPCPHQDIIAAYHEALPALPRVILSRWSSSKSAQQLRARWREDQRHRSLDFWRRFFAAVKTNPHWMGSNQRGWTADLHWLIKRENFDKVLGHLVNGNRQEVRHG